MTVICFAQQEVETTCVKILIGFVIFCLDYLHKYFSDPVEGCTYLINDEEFWDFMGVNS